MVHIYKHSSICNIPTTLHGKGHWLGYLLQVVRSSSQDSCGSSSCFWVAPQENSGTNHDQDLSEVLAAIHQSSHCCKCFNHMTSTPIVSMQNHLWKSLRSALRSCLETLFMRLLMASMARQTSSRMCSWDEEFMLCPPCVTIFADHLCFVDIQLLLKRLQGVVPRELLDVP